MQAHPSFRPLCRSFTSSHPVIRQSQWNHPLGSPARWVRVKNKTIRNFLNFNLNSCFYISGVKGYNHKDHSPVLCSLFITCPPPHGISSPTYLLLNCGALLGMARNPFKWHSSAADGTIHLQKQTWNWISNQFMEMDFSGLSRAISGQLPHVQGQQ